MIAIITAVARDGTIGDNGQIPWDLPPDLDRFRRLTLGSTCIMGRRTWESLPSPLDERKNIVITRDHSYDAGRAAYIYHDPIRAISEEAGDLFVIGGRGIYQALLPYADHFYLTRVHAYPSGDTLFPLWRRDRWECETIERRKYRDLRFDFVNLVRSP